MSDRIVKLVFLRVTSGPEGTRKAVVPLVEGCDFEQFLQRVRRRLGLPDHVTPTLADAAGAVDSIDRLLEVDEGTPLDVTVPYVPPPAAPPPPPAPPVAAGATATPAGAARGPMHRASLGPGVSSPGGADAVGAPPAHRLDVPATPFGDGEDEGGASKYQRRRPRSLVSLARSRRVVLGLLVLAGVGFGAYQMMLA